MNIIYNDTMKNLPIEQLYKLFTLVGWTKGECDNTTERLKGFIQPWINSTLVVSAWDGDKLVGAVRVLSDTIFRSIIYDLLVAPEYQRQGVGKELVNRCKSHYPDSEWLVGCDRNGIEFYKKLGFQDVLESGVFLVIPCKLF